MEQELKRVCKVCGRELPISDFHSNRHGITHTCHQCVSKKRQDSYAFRKMKDSKIQEQAIAEARQARLEDFTPRELLAQLKRWGFRLKGTLTEVKQIDTDNIEI